MVPEIGSVWIRTDSFDIKMPDQSQIYKALIRVEAHLDDTKQFRAKIFYQDVSEPKGPFTLPFTDIRPGRAVRVDPQVWYLAVMKGKWDVEDEVPTG